MKKRMTYLGWLFIVALVIAACQKEDPEPESKTPKACFDDPGILDAGTPVSFSSSCSENALSFLWTFGDGSTSTEANPTHTYTQGGTFTVTLTVDNGEGDTDDASRIITMESPSMMEHSGAITSNETWGEGTHLVTGDVYVNGAILTIEPGAVVLFNSGYGIYVGYNSGFSGAAMIADGTADKPITFSTSVSNKVAGAWDYIGFYDNSAPISSMQYCMVEFGGGYSGNFGSIYVSGTSVAIDHCTISKSASYGINLDNEGYFRSFTENTLSENASNPIGIYGNWVHTLGEGNLIQSELGIIVEGDRMEQDEVSWLEQTVFYFLKNDLYIGSSTGAHLTIMPGVEIRMGGGAGVYVGYYSGDLGILTAEGTEGKRIKFTSALSPSVVAPGAWDFIGIYDGAGTSSSFDYCDFEYGGGYSNNFGMIYVSGSAVSLTNSTISNSASMGISFDNAGWFTACENNTFEANVDVPIEIYGNYVHTIGAGNSFTTGPGILVMGDRVEQADVTWMKLNTPYIIEDDIYLGSSTGAKLTIEPGTTIKFAEGSSLYIGYNSGTFGILVADGDVDNPITFTSGAPEGFQSAGDWDGIWFYDGTGNNTILDYCVVSYGGGYSNNSGSLNALNGNAGVPVISNCLIENSEAWGIYMDNTSAPTLTDNTFANNALGNTNR
jgi:parallel beta-helix repeat protein